MRTPTVSVVIPAYNEERALPALLASLASQTVRPTEIIVADAKSTDRTASIARRAGAKVVAGGLPARGRNMGAKAAKGDVILFLDADVTLTPDFIERGIAEFTKRNLGIATCYVSLRKGDLFERAALGLSNLALKACKSWYPHAPGFCIFARRSVHRAVGGFDETLKLAEDHDYAQRASKRTRFDILSSVRIPFSTRRLKKDGLAKVAAVYALAELHMIMLGPIRTDIFRYGFGGYQ